MTKQDLLCIFDDVIESTKLWYEMSDHLFALGAEIFETKYGHSLFLHQKLVWQLIKEFRGYDEKDEYDEFTVFIDTLYDLSKNYPFSYTDSAGSYHNLTDREKILDLFLSPDCVLREILTINTELLNLN